MSLFTTLLLALVVLTANALKDRASILQNWLSGCLISVTVLIAVMGGIVGIIAFGSFLFNL